MIAYSHYESDPRLIRAAEAAIEAGYQVDFLALGREGEGPCADIRGVRVHHLARKRYRGGELVSYVVAYGAFFVRCFWKSIHLSLHRRYRVVHVNNMPDFLVFSTVFQRMLGAKVILDIHDPMPDTFASKFRSRGGFFFRVLLLQELLSTWYADRVITVHEPVRDGVLVKHGLKRESIGVIANFPDIAAFAYCASYEINGPVRLIFHGTILERSGLRTLVHALAGAQQRHRLRLTIIGEGDFSAALNQLIHEHGLSEIVEFDNKLYPVRDIPARLAHMHVGVVPLEISSSTNYALPLKLIEYVAIGLPVISVRSAAILHYFSEADCLFFDWGDTASLSHVFDHIAVNPGILYRYHQRAAVLREKYSWGAEKKKYIALLRELGARREIVPEPHEAMTNS